MDSKNESLLQNSQNIEKSHANTLKRDRILVILGGICIHLVLGTSYLWGSISIYIASYLRSFDSSVDIGMMIGLPPIAGVGMNLGMVCGLVIAERVGYRLVLATAISLISLSVFFTSFLTSYVGFVLVYGVLFGFCCGSIYIVPVVCGWKYFPNNKGLVSGFMIGAYGFGSFIFNFVALGIVNPSDVEPNEVYDKYKYFDSDVYSRVPSMFRWLSLCYFALGMVGVILIRVPKISKRVTDVSVSVEESTELISNEQIQGNKIECQSIKEGVKSRAFLTLFTIAYCGSFTGLFMASNFKVYGITNIPDDAFLTLVGSLGSVANGCTRAIWALFFDKFGFRKVYIVLAIIQSILAPTIILISSVKPLYLIWYCLIMSCEGGHFSMLPSVSAKVFGLKYGPKIYGVMFWAFTLVSFTVFLITNYGMDTIGWNTMFFVACGLTLVAFSANFIFKERFSRKN